MKTPGLFLGICATSCWIECVPVCLADSFPLARTFDRTLVTTNAPVNVSINFTNGGTNTLRGFFYGEQVPAGFTLTPGPVSINGRSVTNYVLETGFSGDVAPGYAPWRWKFESPTNFPETNMVAPQAAVQINFSLITSNPGAYVFQQFDWAAYTPVGSNSFFGYSQSNDVQVVNVVLSTNPPTVTVQPQSNVIIIQVSGTPSMNYVLEGSSDLTNWTGLLTNLPPILWTNDFTLQPRYYYRGRLMLGLP